MTTHPEDAMTRERALQSIADGSFPDASTLAINGDWHTFVERLQGIAKAALASAQQEPAPAADAEGIARKAAEQIVDELAAKAMHYRLGRIQTIIASALRRCAGDGGVTGGKS